MPQHLKVTQAGLVSLAVTAIGQLVAFVPSLKPEASHMISVASIVIAAVFLAVNAVHAVIALVRDLIASKNKVTLAELETGIRALAHDEIQKVNLNQLAQDAVSGQNIKQLVDERVKAALGNLGKLLDSTSGGSVTVQSTSAQGNPPPPPTAA